MKKVEKVKRLDVFGLVTEKVDYLKSDNQNFYETPRTWELWQEEPLWFMGRWRKVNVLGVIDGNNVYQIG